MTIFTIDAEHNVTAHGNRIVGISDLRPADRRRRTALPFPPAGELTCVSGPAAKSGSRTQARAAEPVSKPREKRSAGRRAKTKVLPFPALSANDIGRGRIVVELGRLKILIEYTIRDITDEPERMVSVVEIHPTHHADFKPQEGRGLQDQTPALAVMGRAAANS